MADQRLLDDAQLAVIIGYTMLLNGWYNGSKDDGNWTDRSLDKFCTDAMQRITVLRLTGTLREKEGKGNQEES